MPTKNPRDLLSLALAGSKFPRKLFKYRGVSDWTERIISQSALWFSPPHEFNDPFDFQIADAGDYSDAELETYLLRQGLEAAEVADILANRGDDRRLRALIDASKAKIFGNKGVLCLSIPNDSILMWAHYADCHTGIVFEFDVAKDLDFFLIPVRVKYDARYPVVRHLVDGTMAVKKCIETKSSVWAYEQEIRIVKPQSGSIPFAKAALTAVYFGCRASAETVDHYSDLLTAHGFSDTALYRARKDEAEYRLRFDRMK